MNKNGNRVGLVDIDVVKLRGYLDQQNIKLTRLSEDMGYDKSYLSGVVRGTQKISKPAYKMLCMILSVDESMFTIQDEPATPTPSAAFGNTTIRPVAPEQMDALIGAINAQVEVLDRLYTMLDTKLNGLVSMGIPLSRLNNNFYDFAVSMGMPDTKPRRPRDQQTE